MRDERVQPAYVGPVTVSDHGPLVSCQLRGEIDLAVVGRIEAVIERLDLSRVTTLEVDATGVDFMDSTGLAFLVRLHERAVAAGTALVVVIHRGGPVARVLELTGVADRMTIVGDGTADAAEGSPPAT